ncbi:DNA methylase N-4 [bacterium]|nr:DNA methylase N-4 [bacterium]
MQIPEVGIRYFAPAALKCKARTFKIYNEEDICIISKVLSRYGFIMPVVIDAGKNIVFGQEFVVAAKKLGLGKIPTIEVNHLKEKELSMFSLGMTNILQRGEMNIDYVVEEIKRWISDMNIELIPEDIGLSSNALDNLFVSCEIEPEVKTEGELELPAEIPAVTKLGDLIALGRHRLYCGDSLKRESYEILLKDEKANIVLTDPPYNVKIQGNVTKQKQHDEFAVASGEMSKTEFTDFLRKVFTMLKAYSKQDSLHYLFMDWRHTRELQLACENIYQRFLNICVWNKMRGGMGSFYRSQHEFCFVYQNGNGSYKNNIQLGKNGRNRTNVWDYPGMNISTKQAKKLRKLHPTVKPTAMLMDILLDASEYGDIVLDCFGGSGSTLIAAQQCGRRARLIELSPHYCDVIIARWEELTGQKHQIIERIN